MKHTENIAVIDIGSNSLRLLIGNLEKNKINKLYSDRTVTRLGKNIVKDGLISAESAEVSINTLKKFKKISEKYNVSCIIAIGTSALREAKNSKHFCETIKNIIGIDIHIISGKQEAYYTLCGVMNENFDKEDSIFILDIGGGSTEWVYWKEQSYDSGSLLLGALKIKEKFLNTDPYYPEFIFKAEEFIKKEIEKFLPQVKIDKLIATGGTASTLAMINMELSEYCPEKTHMSEINMDKIKQILEKLLSISLEDRKKIKGILADRADTICSGLLILEKIAEYLKIEKVIISENGILEGIMKKYKDFCYNDSI